MADNPMPTNPSPASPSREVVQLRSRLSSVRAPALSEEAIRHSIGYDDTIGDALRAWAVSYVRQSERRASDFNHLIKCLAARLSSVQEQTGRECERCKQPMSAFEDDGESDLCMPCARNLAHAFMAARLTSGVLAAGRTSPVSDVPSDPEQAACAKCGLPKREHRMGYGAHRCAFVGRSPGFENRCEKTLNEGRHVCLLAKDHDGDCRPMVNAPWPPVPSGEARETMFRDVWDFAQRAYVLLDNLTDEEECRRDHHGACQTHLGERDCSNARAIALLDQYSERFDEIEEALPLAASSPSPSSVPKDTTEGTNGEA